MLELILFILVVMSFTLLFIFWRPGYNKPGKGGKQ